MLMNSFIGIFECCRCCCCWFFLIDTLVPNNSDKLHTKLNVDGSKINFVRAHKTIFSVSNVVVFFLELIRYGSKIEKKILFVM